MPGSCPTLWKKGMEERGKEVPGNERVSSVLHFIIPFVQWRNLEKILALVEDKSKESKCHMKG